MYALRYLGSEASDGFLPVSCAIACSCGSTLVGLGISLLFAGRFSLPIPT